MNTTCVIIRHTITGTALTTHNGVIGRTGPVTINHLKAALASKLRVPIEAVDGLTVRHAYETRVHFTATIRNYITY